MNQKTIQTFTDVQISRWLMKPTLSEKDVYWHKSEKRYRVRNRYYSSDLGRFVSRDPKGYVDGVSMYQAYMVPNGLDPMGLTTRSDIASGRLSYTCNCGWIDWGHLNPNGPRGVTTQLLNPIKNESGINAISSNGFIVNYKQSMGGMGVSVSSGGDYYIKSGLNETQKASVALAIFMEVSIGFETMQGQFPFSLASGQSSFSQEDLVSNMIGFYIGWKDLSIGFAEMQCKSVSIKESERIWDESEGLGKNTSFKATYKQSCECEDESKQFPGAFSDISPANKGDLWRDAVPADWDMTLMGK